MSLTVVVESENRMVTVNSLEELMAEIKQYDPSEFVQIIFTEKTEYYTDIVTATVDP